MADGLIKLGGLWTGKDRNGKTFLSGKLSPTVKILIFPNQFRESENHPTHIMYLAPVETQGREADQEGDAFSPAPQRYQTPEDVPPLPEEEYATVRRSQPRPQQARPTHRQPAPPPDYDQDDYLGDPFAEDAPAPAPARPQRPGTGSRAPF